MGLIPAGGSCMKQGLGCLSQTSGPTPPQAPRVVSPTVSQACDWAGQCHVHTRANAVARTMPRP